MFAKKIFRHLNKNKKFLSYNSCFKLLTTTKDIYNGLHIEIKSLPNEINEFSNLIKTSLLQWEQEKITGIWLYLPKNKLSFLETALKYNFEMHHCNKEEIILTKWLLKNVSNKIPSYCTHYVGCGGVVINKNNEMLLVKEKLPFRKGWGLPGGQTNKNEFSFESSMREVYEETGIKTQFIELLGIREINNFRFNSSEIYFLNFLKALNTDFNICNYEIAEARWFCKNDLEKIVENEDTWSPTMLDSIKIGIGKIENFQKKICQYNKKTVFDNIERDYYYSCPIEYGNRFKL